MGPGAHLLRPRPLRLRSPSDARGMVRELLLRFLGVWSLDVRGGPLGPLPPHPPHRRHRRLLLPDVLADAVEQADVGGFQEDPRSVSSPSSPKYTRPRKSRCSVASRVSGPPPGGLNL